MNKLILSVLSLMALALAPVSSFAASLNDLQVQALDKVSASEYVLPGNATLVKITYVGVATQAAVGITNSAFVTQAPIGTSDLSIDLSAAAYDTLGEFCDAVNADDNYNCVLTGGKRDDSSLLLNDVTLAAGTDAKAAGGYSVTIDTGGAVHVAGTYINRLGITPAAGKRVVLKYCDVQSDAVGTLKVYGKLRKYVSTEDGVTRGDVTLVASMATADDTAEVDGNVYGGEWMEFAKDAHVVVSVGNVATAQTATSYISCFWEEK